MRRDLALPHLMFVLTLQGCGCNPDDPPDTTSTEDATEGMDPGVRTLARLNQRQYNYAVRDLLGTQKTPADVFPRDEIDNWFDNQGTALSTTSVHVELWEGAANQVLDEMFGRVAEKHGAALYPFFLNGVAADAALNQSDGIHPNTKGVAIIVQNTLPAVEALLAEIKE